MYNKYESNSHILRIVVRGGTNAVRGLKVSASDGISEDAVKMYPCGSGIISVPRGYFFKETSMTGYIATMLSYPFMQRAFLVGALVSLCSALLGVSLVLKRYSMIGDGLSHVGFGALSTAAVFSSSGSAFLRFLGANPLVFTIPVVIIAAFFLLRLSESSRINGDSAIAVISTAAFAFGVMVVSLTTGINTDVFNYMFGSISALVGSYVPIYVIMSLITVALFVLSYNKMFALTFDEDFAKSSGMRVGLYKMLIALLCAITVVLGMKIIGTMLITALIVLPPLSAMRICRSFRSVVCASAIISVACCTAGITISYAFSAPAGASIVMVNLLVLALCAIYSKLSSMREKKHIHQGERTAAGGEAL